MNKPDFSTPKSKPSAIGAANILREKSRSLYNHNAVNNFGAQRIIKNKNIKILKKDGDIVTIAEDSNNSLTEDSKRKRADITLYGDEDLQTNKKLKDYEVYQADDGSVVTVFNDDHDVENESLAHAALDNLDGGLLTTANRRLTPLSLRTRAGKNKQKQQIGGNEYGIEWINL